MALTVTLSGDWLSSIGNKRAVSGTITFDSSYDSGGESLTAANIGLGRIERIEFNQGEDGYVFEYDYSASKVIVYTPSQPTFTVASSGAIGTNMEIGLSADSAAATVEGGTGITASRTLTTTSPVGAPTLTQVTASTNLSAVVVEFWAIGI